MDAPPSPLLPRTVKCWDFGSQEEVGFLVEFFFNIPHECKFVLFN